MIGDKGLDKKVQMAEIAEQIESRNSRADITFQFSETRAWMRESSIHRVK